MSNQRAKNKLIHGMAVNDLDKNVIVDGKAIPLYACWKAMLQRCYDSKVHTKYPTYIGCTVCEEWLTFSNFKKWYDENYREGFQLDKDILVEGNKIYSPETCRYVPHYLNSLLNDCRGARGKYPTGVSEEKPNNRNRRLTQAYRASYYDIEGIRRSKIFKTVVEAQSFYSKHKAERVRFKAQQAIDAGEIQQDVYDALIARKF